VVLPAGNWAVAADARIGPTGGRRWAGFPRGALARTPKGVFDYNVYLTLARLARLLPAHTVLLSQLTAQTRLSSTEKEIVI
jgi:hypothetical protein